MLGSFELSSTGRLETGSRVKGASLDVTSMLWELAASSFTLVCLRVSGAASLVPKLHFDWSSNSCVGESVGPSTSSAQ